MSSPTRLLNQLYRSRAVFTDGWRPSNPLFSLAYLSSIAALSLTVGCLEFPEFTPPIPLDQSPLDQSLRVKDRAPPASPDQAPPREQGPVQDAEPPPPVDMETVDEGMVSDLMVEVDQQLCAPQTGPCARDENQQCALSSGDVLRCPLSSTGEDEEIEWVFLSWDFSLLLHHPTQTGNLDGFHGARDFYISRSEISVAQYQRCVTEGGCEEPMSDVGCTWSFPDQEQRMSLPVNCVSWTQAQSFCHWAGTESERGRPGRLPGFAEWLFAARTSQHELFRAGSGRSSALSLFPWGDGFYSDPTGNGCFNAWHERCAQDGPQPPCAFDERCASDERPSNCVVSGEQREAYDGAGAFCDLSGNLKEWILDLSSGFTHQLNGEPYCPDGSCLESNGSERYVIGGSFNDSTAELRLVEGLSPRPMTNYSVEVGFRCLFSQEDNEQLTGLPRERE